MYSGRKTTRSVNQDGKKFQEYLGFYYTGVSIRWRFAGRREGMWRAVCWLRLFRRGRGVCGAAAGERDLMAAMVGEVKKFVGDLLRVGEMSYGRCD